MTQMNLSTKQKQTHRRREQTCGCQRVSADGGGMEWEFGISRCKLVYIGWINNKVLLYSTGNYTQCLLITYNGKEYEKEYVCVVYIYIYTHTYITESYITEHITEYIFI